MVNWYQRWTDIVCGLRTQLLQSGFKHHDNQRLLMVECGHLSTHEEDPPANAHFTITAEIHCQGCASRAKKDAAQHDGATDALTAIERAITVWRKGAR